MCPGRERGGFKPESLSAAVGCAQGFSQLAARHGGARQYQVLYRRPHGTEWETLDLDTAMDMIAVGSWTRAAGAGSRRWTGTGLGGASLGRATQARTASGRRSR